MKFSGDHQIVRMTLYEWSKLPILPRDFWRHSQTEPGVINWLPRWPKSWRWVGQYNSWYMGHLHVGLTGRTYFYYPRIILRPTQKELEYIMEEQYRIGYRLAGESFGRPPTLHIMPQEVYNG